MPFEGWYRALLQGGLIFLGVSCILFLIRAILGPRFTDRIIAINVIGTKAVVIIAVLAWLTGWDSLLDIAIVYAMVSFLAVVVLSKCYLLPSHKNPADPEHDFHSDYGKKDEREGTV